MYYSDPDAYGYALLLHFFAILLAVITGIIAATLLIKRIHTRSLKTNYISVVVYAVVSVALVVASLTFAAYPRCCGQGITFHQANVFTI